MVGINFGGKMVGSVFCCFYDFLWFFHCHLVHFSYFFL